MKTVLIISYSPLHRDPRVLRQIQALKHDYKIITIGYTSVNNDAIVHYLLNRPNNGSFVHKMYKLMCGLLRKFNNYTERTLEMMLDLKNILSKDILKPDVIIANDWHALYLSSALKSKYNWVVKIYFDVHEYWLNDDNSNSIKGRLLIRPIITEVLKKCKSDINCMTTVCDGIAREYEKFFGFSEGFVSVITNAPEYNDNLKPKAVEGDIIKLIHHGGAVKKRKLELMIEMMRYLDPDKYELTFMLVKIDHKHYHKYYDYLVKKSKMYKNIKFIEPVNFREITSTLNGYDMGVYILSPENFNYKNALPNKLFEFVQARLAIAIGPSVEMAKIVNKYGLGVCANNFSPKSLADSISQITPSKILDYKKNSEKYARELSAEVNITKIRDIVAELTKE